MTRILINMGSPQRGSKTGAVLAFGISAITVWSTAVGATWLVQRGLRSGDRHGNTSQIVAFRPAIRLEGLSEQLREQLMTGQECATAVAEVTPSAIGDFLKKFDTTFWRTNPNAAIFLRQAALCLGKQIPMDRLMGDLLSLFKERGLDEFLTRRLIRVAFSGLLEAREVSREDLVVMLRAMPEADALSLLEVWLDFQQPGSPQSDLDTALQVAAQFSPQLNDQLRDDIVAMVVRVWSHRAPPLADALLFATKFERTRVHDRLLFEGSQMLGIANPEELQRRLIQFAPVMAKEAGALAANAGLRLAQAFAMAKEMQQKEADEFLRTYVDSFGAGDPREMSMIAENYRAKDLPEAVAGSVAKGLMKGSDRGSMDVWMEGLSTAAQAKLWDAVFSPFEPLDPTVARYYLQKRPKDVPPNVWVMKRVLNVLPYEEAMQALPLAGELKGQFRTEIPEGISRNRIQKLLTEAPEQVPAFLATLPAEVARGAISQSLGEWVDPDPQMLQSWIEQMDDSSLRAELQNRVLENETKYGSLAEVQNRIVQLMSSGGSPETYGKRLEQILSAETDSRRAAAFIQQLPDGNTRDQVILAFAKKWSALDPVAASGWLAELPAGRGRDLATRELIFASRDDPERALANAAGIEAPALRFTAARSVLRVWRDSDPVRAEAFIRSAGFSPDEESVLRSILGSRSKEDSK